MSAEATLFALVAEHLGAPVEQVSVQSRLVADLGGDSLSLVHLVDAVEARFGIFIDDDRLNAMERVSDLLGWIEADGKGAET